MSKTLESTLQAALLMAAPRELPTLRLFRRNIGAARMPSGAKVQFAVAGQCDLYGYLRGGQSIEVELKALDGRLSPEQEEWAEFCRQWDVPHVVLQAKAGETTEDTVRRWCKTLQYVVIWVQARCLT